MHWSMFDDGSFLSFFLSFYFFLSVSISFTKAKDHLSQRVLIHYDISGYRRIGSHAFSHPISSRTYSE